MKQLHTLIAIVFVLSNWHPLFAQTNNEFCLQFTTPDGQNIQNVSIDYSVVNVPPPSTTGLATSNVAGKACVPTNANSTQLDFDVVPMTDHRNGVNAYDLVLIRRQILGIAPFSPFSAIAADVNRSGSVTTFDIVELRKLINGIYPALPQSPSWVFAFPDQINPTSFSGFGLNNFSVDVSADSAAVWGIKTGDVNSSGVYNDQMTETPPVGTACLYFTDQQVTAGTTVEVTFSVNVELEALQGQLNLNGLQVQEIVSSPSSGAGFGIFSDKVTFVEFTINGDLITFTLKFNVLQSGNLYDMITLGSDITRPMAFKSNGDWFDGCLNAVSGSAEAVAVQHKVTPNPWQGGRAQITWTQPLSSDGYLVLMNAQGQVVLEKTVPAGSTECVFEQTATLPKGVLFYQMRTAEGQLSGKVVRI